MWLRKAYPENPRTLVLGSANWDKRRGISKKLHLKPAEWTHIWDTDYIPQVSHNLYVNLGGKDKSKKSITLADFESKSSEV